MKLNSEKRDILIGKIQQALTQEQLAELLPRQVQLIEQGLDSLLKTRTVEEITIEMIQGEYEIVTEVVAHSFRILVSEALHDSP